MKKVIKSFLALSMAAFALASCEDVPAPYEIPGSADNGGDTELPEGVYLDQSFTSSLGDFKSIGNNENIAWEIDYSSACITGYKDYGSGSKSNQAGVTYLVSPEIDLTNAKEAHVEMTYALNYERADINTNNALLISKDYADDPTKATWVAIPYSTEGVNSSFDFVDVASNIPADFIGGKVRLALRHTCTASQSSTWEVKSLAVKEGKAEVVNPGDNPGDNPGGNLGEGEYINETFATSFGSFTVKTIKGLPWIIDYSCAKATGYVSPNTTPSESYIVSQPINLSSSKGACVNFDYILRYYTNYGAAKPGVADKVLITANYTGDPSTTTWTDITGTLTEGSDWNTWYKYSVDVPATLIGKDNVVLALYYACEDNSATWEVKNLVVKEGKAESGSTGGDNTGDNPGDNPGGTPGTVDGNTITVKAADFGLDNGTALGTLTLSDSTTITFASGGNNNAPKYYNSGTNFRMYPKNTMTVKSTKTIASITINCDNFNGTIYNASGDITADPGTLATNDAVISITGINNATTTITDVSQTSGAASQLRIVSMSITYAQ